MITITGRDKRAEAVDKLRKERITIERGDRIIYLYPTDRVIGKGYGEILVAYDVVFVNKAKGIKINGMSFNYCLRNYSVRGYTSDVYVAMGLEFWFKGEEIINPIVRNYTDKQIEAFHSFIETAILEELEII